MTYEKRNNHHRFTFAINRDGIFTDIYCEFPDKTSITMVVSQHSAYYRGPYTSTKPHIVENSEPVRNTECSFNNRPPLSSGQVRDNRNNFVVSSSVRSSTVDSGDDSRTNSTNGSGDSENGSDNTSDQGEPSNGSEQSEEDVNQAETKRARHGDQITPKSVKEESIQNSRGQLYS